jgi:anti-sigma factor RsiW
VANQPSDALLHRYLLATASPDEAQAVEDAYSVDPELFDRLMELDDTLLDRYLDDSLTPDERAEYERSFDAFPRRHQRVRLMRDVAGRTARSPSPSDASTAGAPRPVDGVRRRPPWSWTWGLAAATAIVAAVALTRQATLQRRLDDSVTAQATLRRDLAAAQESARRLREEALANGQPGGTVRPGTDAARVVALALAPGLLRDGLLPLTTIPEGALLVRAELVLPATPAVTYRARVTTATGRERWSQDDLTATDRAGQRVLRVDLPVTMLPPGHVVISVSGRSPDGAAVPVEEFHFRIAER